MEPREAEGSDHAMRPAPRCRPPRRTLLSVASVVLAAPSVVGAQPACRADSGGLDLPPEFCAVIVVRDAGRPRHIVVAPNGDVYAALRGGRGVEGGILALRDTTGDGRADVVERFGDRRGGTGIALHDGYLYFGRNDAVLRYALRPGELVPSGDPQVVVSGLPSDRSHAAKSIAVTPDGSLFVNIGSPSNSCQEEDRALRSPGLDPCPELERRAGIWVFDAARLDQLQDDGERWATGLRNTVALTVHPGSGQPYGVVHGRDQLHQNWEYTERASAEKPSEEFHRLESGGRYSWPYCYHDSELGRLVTAPEYGGDGEDSGRCADLAEPLLAFPAHWAPNALVFYDGASFPGAFAGGVFIAFHGSWNRAPLPQGGYNVVFAPFENGRPTGNWAVFADGFAGDDPGPRSARHRPTGLAVGPDGSLYITDDHGGTIWRIFRP